MRGLGTGEGNNRSPIWIGIAVIVLFASNAALLPVASAASLPSYYASVPVGNGPEAAVYSPISQDVYVNNVQDQTVSAISGTGVVATVTVPGYPHSIAYDTQNGNVYTVDSCNCPNNLLSAISTATNTLVGSTALPISNSNFGDFMAFDPANGYLYMNDLTSAVVVFDPSAGHVVATIPLGSGSNNVNAIAYNPANKDMYVASYGSTTSSHTKVSVISSATNKIVGTVTLPGPAHTVFGIDYSPLTQEMYVANYKVQVGSVSAISGTKLVTTIKLDYSGAWAVKFDPADGYVWVTEINGEIALINSHNQLVGTIFPPSQNSYPLLGAAYNPSNSRMYIADGNVVLVFNS